MASRERHITLKEAAAISGYTPDYLGQLIRKGKLSGTQVYSHVSWVTTEEAVLEYIERASGKEVTRQKEVYQRVPWDGMIAALSVCAIVVSIVTILLSFYVFAVLSDRQFSERTHERVASTPKVEIVQQPSGETLSMHQ